MDYTFIDPYLVGGPTIGGLYDGLSIICILFLIMALCIIPAPGGKRARRRQAEREAYYEAMREARHNHQLPPWMW